MAEQRRFPVQNDGGGHISGRSAIPWTFAQRVYEDYRYLCAERGQTPQTLESIAQNGGWGWSQMMEIMVDAAEERSRERSEDELTTKARQAFGEATR